MLNLGSDEPATDDAAQNAQFLVSVGLVLTPPADKKCRKGAILGAGVSITYWEVITAATAVTRPVGHPKKSLTPEFHRI